jgi:hypothetical protein
MKLNKMLFVAMIFCAITCFAQETKWTRVEFEKNLFSVAFPSELVVDAEKVEGNKKLRIWSFGDGVQMTLVVYVSDKSNKPKEILKHTMEPNATESDQTEMGDIYAKKFLFESNSNYSAHFYIATKKRLYYFTFSSNRSDNPKISRFLNSIKTNGKIIFPSDVSSLEETENLISETELKSTPEVLAAINRIPNNLKAIYEVDRKTKLMSKIRKPTPLTRLPILLRTPDFKWDKLKGKTILVRIQLLANGDTKEVTVYSDAADNEISIAVEAVRSIKFLPAQLNGKNVDSYHVYMFNAEITDSSSGILK